MSLSSNRNVKFFQYHKILNSHLIMGGGVRIVMLVLTSMHTETHKHITKPFINFPAIINIYNLLLIALICFKCFCGL
jgi:hypothetical protein